MIFSIINKKIFTNDYVCDTKVIILRQNSKVVNGIITAGKATYEQIDLAENARLYKSSDFDIANILNVGAYELLKPTYVSTLSSMSFADKVQTITSNLSQNVQE